MKKLYIAILLLLLVVFLAVVAFAAPAIRSMGSFPVGGMNSAPVPTIAAVPAPTWTDGVVLTANSVSSYTIPTGAQYLLFGFSASPVYANYNGTAFIPTSASTNGAASAISTGLVYVGGRTVVSLIAPANTIVTISVFK